MVDRIGFPTSLGPFFLKTCQVANGFNAFYRQHAFPRPDPQSAESSMVGIDLYFCGIAQGGILFCQLSPLHRITLEEEVKAASGIPLESEYFAWVYPAVDDGSLGAGTTAEHTFLRYGGYVYLSRDLHAVGTNCIAQAPLGTLGLMFGRAQAQAGSAESKLTQQGRFQAVTLPSLREAGATHFAWIRPGEFGATTAAPDGAFAYKFQRGQTKYFPVVGSPVFLAEMLEELDDRRALVVVRPENPFEFPTVERIVTFDRGHDFLTNMRQAGIGGLTQSRCVVMVSRSQAEEVWYAAWQQTRERETLADPWIMTQRSVWVADTIPADDMLSSLLA